jgi:tRNA pseudouridine32 synthase/23S rRNA pseudouridine746 synthase
MLVDTLTRIHFSDDAIVIAEKASGLLSVPGRGPDRQDCLSARVQAQFADALIVHRLDMETSGLMLFARGIESQRTLSRAFETREVGKRYVAVVAGLMDEDEGSIDLPLICDWPNRPRQMVDHELGKPSLTRYRVLSRDATMHTTRVSLMPVTGRSHQLRVHMAALRHPMLGDSLYAPPGVQTLSPRLLLHATELRFVHPVTGQALTFASEAPF